MSHFASHNKTSAIALMEHITIVLVEPKYAENIGLAFQVADDILNVVGDSSLMGKETGTDASLSKNTFPSILGIDKSKLYAERLVKKAISAIKDFDKTKTEPFKSSGESILFNNAIFLFISFNDIFC